LNWRLGLHILEERKPFGLDILEEKKKAFAPAGNRTTHSRYGNYAGWTPLIGGIS
jgi:hypothetical protein